VFERSRGDVRPVSIFSDEGVCKDDDFAGDGRERQFGGFAAFDEALVESFEIGVAAAGAQRRHVESAAELGTPAMDAALWLGCPAITRKGSEPGKGCGLLDGDAAEFAERSEEGERGDGADAGD